MDICTRHYQNVAILSLTGRLDAVTLPLFAQTINEQVATGYNRLVVDLKKVEYLSSAGISGLLKAAQQARQEGGDFRLANVRAHVKYLLNLAGIDGVIKSYPNVVGATASYFPGLIPGET